METKHTKGTWEYSYTTDDESNSEVAISFIETKKFSIGIIHDKNDFTEQEATANAKLMASAPELLEVLIEIQNRIIDSDEWWMDAPDRGGFDLEKINEIIEKATK